MEDTQQTNKFLVPLAIVIAGALIAGAVYMGGKSPAVVSNSKTVDTSKLEVVPVQSTDHIRGSASADIVLIEYSDTECPFCKIFHQTTKELLSTYGSKLAWVYRQFPIASLHSKATREAEATECVAELGGNEAFWSYLDKIFETTNSNNSLDPAELPKLALSVNVPQAQLNSCLDSGKYTEKVRDSVEEAYKAGGRGTPYTLLALKNSVTSSQASSLNKIVSSRGLYDQTGQPLVNVLKDKKVVSVSGALPIELMKEILDALLK
jgi:protein-disulfide isomerase